MTKPVTSRLRVRVQPNSTRSEIAGWYGGALRVRTTAPPVAGRANRAVAEVLAHALDVPRTDVSVARGHGSRDKVMEIVGIDEPELRRRLERLVAPDTPAATTR
ncbi:MAG: DUF167 domain-containing protein [Chloroflexota bacterium]|nr:DUF167 domain-containing protein [Chloroflexota bacterium]MDE2961997.1 DUF167 domain-containing protein [Chloroflexota bacterium]